MKIWQHSLRLVLGCLMLGLGLPTVTSGAVYTVYWRDQASSGWWVDGNSNHWYRADDGWDVRREDLATGHWHTDGYKNPNKLIFNNAHQTTMTINNLGGAEHRINQILFQNGSSRTFAQDGGAYLKLEGDGTPKIEADAGGTGTYTFSVPLLLAQKVELNPVNGNLTFNGAITNGGNWIDVWGNNGKALNLNGAISGAGGIAVKENSIVVLTNNVTGQDRPTGCKNSDCSERKPSHNGSLWVVAWTRLFNEYFRFFMPGGPNNRKNSPKIAFSGS